MAMIASLVYLDESENFVPYTTKAVKYVLVGYFKRQKDPCFTPVQTPLYGPGPNQSIVGPLRRVKCWITYAKVVQMLADGLNTVIQHKPDRSKIFEVIVSLRALESVFMRTQDPDDVITRDPKILIQTIAIHARLTKTQELTITSEGGEVVYQNEKLTMMKLDYPNYKLTDNKDVEYKITWNAEVDVASGRETFDMAGRCTYHFNSYIVISHGLGHWRVVPRESFNFHMQRMRDVFEKRRIDYIEMCPHLTDFKWSAVMGAIKQNARISERDISGVIKNAIRPKRDPKTQKRMDNHSVIGS